jgi:hypothetical protein
MEFIHCTILLESDIKAVFDLWNNEYPEKLSYDSIKEFELYHNGLKEKNHLL